MGYGWEQKIQEKVPSAAWVCVRQGQGRSLGGRESRGKERRSLEWSTHFFLFVAPEGPGGLLLLLYPFVFWGWLFHGC